LRFGGLGIPHAVLIPTILASWPLRYHVHISSVHVIQLQLWSCTGTKKDTCILQIEHK